MSMPGRRLSEVSPDSNNNFNLLRMIAATAVLVSHAYPLSLGKSVAEPFQASLGINLGTLAVYSFFAISGYFISQSFHRNPNLVEFCVARALRIYPGLIVALILTVAILGPVFTTFPPSRYFTDFGVASYVPLNLSLVRLQYELPGVFDRTPYPRAINGSLWTLSYEAVCYAMVAAIGICRIAATTRRFLGFVIGYLCVYAALSLFHLHSQRFDEIRQLTLPFVIGAGFFHFRKHVRYHPAIAAMLFVLALLMGGYAGFTAVFMLAWCYALFYIGFMDISVLGKYNRVGDYSYGMYIYAFPVGQIVAASVPAPTPLEIMAWGFPASLGLAILSWHLVEKRASARRARAAAFVKQWLEACRATPSLLTPVRPPSQSRRPHRPAAATKRDFGS